MKIRNGFVSNSSSTSYILWIPVNITPKALVKLATETKLFVKHFKPIGKSSDEDKEFDKRMIAETKTGLEYLFKKIKKEYFEDNDREWDEMDVAGISEEAKDELAELMRRGILQDTLAPFVIMKIEYQGQDTYINAAAKPAKIANIESKFGKSG